MNIRRRTSWIIGLGSLLLAACGTVPQQPAGQVPVEDHSTSAVQQGAQTSGANVGGAFSGSELDNPSSPLSKRVIYFAFDSSQISADGRQLVAAHAKYLSQHPDVSVVLEGNTDERGSREYNLALGERRAKAVEQLLELQGVSPKQLQVISFGAEQPVALGHDEAAWSLNRRVELLYSGN